jgi:hypothetical protein
MMANGKRVGAATTSAFNEASGITRVGDRLLIVSDANPGAYYSFAIPDSGGPVLKLLPDKVTRHPLGGGEALAVDLEAVDVLADGRVVALSERLRALIGPEGLVVQYDDPLAELGERGLEGLAVRKIEDRSLVAVVWEGGYVEGGEVQRQVRDRIGSAPLRPVIFTHEITPGETGSKKKVKEDTELVELDVPQADSEPDGWRFRAPDLVWHKGSGVADQDWGYIVLLNSQLHQERPGKAKFGPRWLQRFDRAGRPIGVHLDLDQVSRELLGDDRLRDANWEGLGWFEQGRSLVLVYDGPNRIDDVPVALVVPVPATWR